MPRDKKPFEELDASLRPVVQEIRVAARKVQAPPELLTRSMGRIRQLPPPRRKVDVHRWLSAPMPLAVPALSAITALLIAIPMYAMYNRIAHNENLIRAGEVRLNHLKVTKQANEAVIKASIELSDTDDVTLCKPEKARISGRNRLYLTRSTKEFNNIKITEYKLCTAPDIIIFLPESVLDQLDLDKDALAGQKLDVYELRDEPEKEAEPAEM